MKKNSLIIFICIVFFASLLRLWQLGGEPKGFYSDEALYGYEAYSLLTTGKDQFGHPWPLSIAGFGDYRPAFYIYATIPFIKFLGLTEFATRLPSTLSSIATLIVLFLFTQEITHNKKIALLTMLLFSISPWSIYFARMAHETNLMTFLILSGIYILWRYQGSTWATVIKISLFIAAMYTYHTARVFIPLFLIFTVFLFHKEAFQHKKQLLIGFVLFIMLLLPMFKEFSGEGLARVKGISFWTDPGLLSSINEQRGMATQKGMPSIIAKIIYSKVTIYPQVFVKNYLTHFSPSFLLLKGDSNGIYNIPNTGILLWIEPLLIIVGFIFLWKRQKEFFWWFLVIITIGLIPDSLTRLSPSSARIQVVEPFVAVISGIGLYHLLNRKHRFLLITSIAVVSLLVLNQFWFWHSYLDILPIQNARAWQLGTKEMDLKAQELSSNYDEIWMSRNCWGWIHLVFDLHYNPALLQKEIKHSEKNELGFWWVSDVGKYHLDWFPKNLETNKKRLYIGIPSEFPLGTQPFYVVYHPINKQILFWFVDAKMFQINPSTHQEEFMGGYL